MNGNGNNKDDRISQGYDPNRGAGNPFQSIMDKLDRNNAQQADLCKAIEALVRKMNNQSSSAYNNSNNSSSSSFSSSFGRSGMDSSYSLDDFFDKSKIQFDDLSKRVVRFSQALQNSANTVERNDLRPLMASMESQIGAWVKTMQPDIDKYKALISEQNQEIQKLNAGRKKLENARDAELKVEQEKQKQAREFWEKQRKTNKEQLENLEKFNKELKEKHDYIISQSISAAKITNKSDENTVADKLNRLSNIPEELKKIEEERNKYNDILKNANNPNNKDKNDPNSIMAAYEAIDELNKKQQALESERSKHENELVSDFKIDPKLIADILSKLIDSNKQQKTNNDNIDIIDQSNRSINDAEKQLDKPLDKIHEKYQQELKKFDDDNEDTIKRLENLKKAEKTLEESLKQRTSIVNGIEQEYANFLEQNEQVNNLADSTISKLPAMMQEVGKPALQSIFKDFILTPAEKRANDSAINKIDNQINLNNSAADAAQKEIDAQKELIKEFDKVINDFANSIKNLEDKIKQDEDNLKQNSKNLSDDEKRKLSQNIQQNKILLEQKKLDHEDAVNGKQTAEAIKQQQENIKDAAVNSNKQLENSKKVIELANGTFSKIPMQIGQGLINLTTGYLNTQMSKVGEAFNKVYNAIESTQNNYARKLKMDSGEYDAFMDGVDEYIKEHGYEKSLSTVDIAEEVATMADMGVVDSDLMGSISVGAARLKATGSSIKLDENQLKLLTRMYKDVESETGSEEEADKAVQERFDYLMGLDASIKDTFGTNMFLAKGGGDHIMQEMSNKAFEYGMSEESLRKNEIDLMTMGEAFMPYNVDITPFFDELSKIMEGKITEIPKYLLNTLGDQETIKQNMVSGNIQPMIKDMMSETLKLAESGDANALKFVTEAYGADFVSSGQIRTLSNAVEKIEQNGGIPIIDESLVKANAEDENKAIQEGRYLSETEKSNNKKENMMYTAADIAQDMPYGDTVINNTLTGIQGTLNKMLTALLNQSVNLFTRGTGFGSLGDKGGTTTNADGTGTPPTPTDGTGGAGAGANTRGGFGDFMKGNKATTWGKVGTGLAVGAGAIQTVSAGRHLFNEEEGELSDRIVNTFEDPNFVAGLGTMVGGAIGGPAGAMIGQVAGQVLSPVVNWASDGLEKILVSTIDDETAVYEEVSESAKALQESADKQLEAAQADLDNAEAEKKRLESLSVSEQAEWLVDNGVYTADQVNKLSQEEVTKAFTKNALGEKDENGNYVGGVNAKVQKAQSAKTEAETEKAKADWKAGQSQQVAKNLDVMDDDLKTYSGANNDEKLVNREKAVNANITISSRDLYDYAEAFYKDEKGGYTAGWDTIIDDYLEGYELTNELGDAKEEYRTALKSNLDKVTTNITEYEKANQVFKERYAEAEKIFNEGDAYTIALAYESEYGVSPSGYITLEDGSVELNPDNKYKYNKEVYESHIGKYAIGLDYVPYDNYPAILHEGEMILNKQTAEHYRHDSILTQDALRESISTQLEDRVLEELTDTLYTSEMDKHLTEMVKGAETNITNSVANTSLGDMYTDEAPVIETDNVTLNNTTLSNESDSDSITVDRSAIEHNLYNDISNSLIEDIDNLTDNENSSSSVNKYATGLDYVPEDNFPALLHEGETVLNKQTANHYRDNSIITTDYINTALSEAVDNIIAGGDNNSYNNTTTTAIQNLITKLDNKSSSADITPVTSAINSQSDRIEKLLTKILQVMTSHTYSPHSNSRKYNAIVNYDSNIARLSNR